MNDKPASRLSGRTRPYGPTSSQVLPSRIAQHLAEAGVVTEAELLRMESQVSGDARGGAGDIETVVRRLEKAGRLSSYQSQQFLAGRGGDLVVGEYTLVEPLGAGGMGVVFLAEHRRMRRKVAIKFLPERFSGDSQMVRRFEREVAVAAQLTHPHVVAAYDAGEHHGRLYLVMQYVDGCDLASLTQTHGPLDAEDAVRCVIQASQGMAYAHDQNVIHRDLKPGNLLLGGDGVVRVLDLGLARWRMDSELDADSALSITGVVMGTIDYMAPEQAANAKAATVRSDVYSLGCTLYALLRGEPPFQTETVVERLWAHRESPIPPLLPEEDPRAASWNEAFTRMLAKNPEQRYASMREVADALQPLLSSPELEIFPLLPDRPVDPSIAPPTTSPNALADTQPAPGFEGVTPSRSAKVSRRRAALGLAALATSCGAALAAWKYLPGGRRPVVEIIPGPLPEDRLLVGKSGRVHFTTISEALSAARPGMTVTVIDDSVYDESLFLMHANYRGLTLESPRRATIALPDARILLQIINVPDVTVRGFRFELQGIGVACVLGGNVAGTLLEDLHFQGNVADGGLRSTGGSAGLSMEKLRVDAADPPVVVRRCSFAELSGGIRVSGIENDYRTMTLCRGAIIQNCRISRCTTAVNLVGDVRRIIVAHNLIHDSAGYGIQLEELGPDAGQLLVANNSLLRCVWPFRVWSSAVQWNQAEVINNVSLESSPPDWLFIDSGGTPLTPRGAGDAEGLLRDWRFAHNFRESGGFSPEAVFAEAWIPLSPEDQEAASLEAGPRNPAASDFLQPPLDSPLATQGQGGDLPGYVGAVPPAGQSAEFDWVSVYRQRLAADPPDRRP